MTVPITNVSSWYCSYSLFYRVLVVCFLFLAGCRDAKSPPSTKSGAAADSAQPAACLEENLGLAIPETATNVRCRVQAVFVMWLFARFEIPRQELPALLSRSPLDKLPPLSEADHDVPKNLQSMGPEIPWWDVSTAEGLVGSSVEWREPGTDRGSDSDFRCCLTVCVGETGERPGGEATVYILYIEEPIGRK